MTMRSNNASVVDMGWPVGASLWTSWPVRLDVAELPQSRILRKYVCVVTGVDQLASEPVKD